MDDANAPSLLSLPYFGACTEADPVYLATRRWVLSPENPWWFHGPAGEGVGSPHTGPGLAWPIAIAMRGLTAAAENERLTAIRLLGASHAGTFLAHESFDVGGSRAVHAALVRVGEHPRRRAAGARRPRRLAGLSTGAATGDAERQPTRFSLPVRLA